MNYVGSCGCRSCRIEVSIDETLAKLNPRVCDCEYCQAHPAGLTSDPRMTIEVTGDKSALIENKNGDLLATFYRCKDCGDLLAVGCTIDGESRGAVNAFLLEEKASLGKPVAIQPRLLSAAEKVARWTKLWGVLKLVT